MLADYFVKPLEQLPKYGKDFSEFRVLMTPKDGVTYVPVPHDAFYYNRLHGDRIIVTKVEDNGINIYTVQVLTMDPKVSIDKKWFENVTWSKLG